MEIRNDFPLLNSSTYLNTAYVGLMSKSLYDFRVNFELEYLLEGDEYKLNAYKRLDITHASIADFISSQKDQTYFVPNFSTGIRLVLDRLKPGTNLLFIDEDYHSLLSAIEERDFNLFSVKMQENIESAIANALEKNSIDVLALSIVQYTNGLIIDLDFISELKNKYPELLIIGDVTQYIGTNVFNFSVSSFDAIVCSGYKWLLAGFGSGFIAVSDDFLRLTNSTKAEMQTKIFAGHFNILAAASLVFALDYLKSKGFEKLIEKNHILLSKLRKGLSDLGLKPAYSSRKKQSSIVSIPYKESISKILEESKIRFSHRGNYIRFSVHFYNTETDIEKLLSVFDEKVFV